MSVLERIQAEVEGHPIVLFMKGTPQFPMCGFSSRTVQALKAAGASQLHTVNVLEDPEIRANLPRYSELADVPAAVHQRRADRRLRHHHGAVRVRRAGAHDQRSAAGSERSRRGRAASASAERSTGRVVLVTGAHGGLGSAAALACARAGATVVLLGRKVPKLNRVLRRDRQPLARSRCCIRSTSKAPSPDDYAELAQRASRPNSAASTACCIAPPNSPA